MGTLPDKDWTAHGLTKLTFRKAIGHTDKESFLNRTISSSKYPNIAAVNLSTSSSKAHLEGRQHAQIFINNGLRVAAVLHFPLWS